VNRKFLIPIAPTEDAFDLAEWIATQRYRNILSKIGLIAFTMALTFTGASYAADKVTLICSDGEGADDYSLLIDLDRKLASFHVRPARR
jgi:hypothetical protein